MNQPDKVLYAVKDLTTGGRDGGASRSSDGRLDISFADVRLSVGKSSETLTKRDDIEPRQVPRV